MKSPKRCGAVRKLLDLCDDLQRIRSKLADPELLREARTRLRRQSTRKLGALTRDLRAYRYRGPLGAIIREFKLGADHFQVLSTLLHRHLRSEEVAIEGRLILGSVYETSYEVLSGTELLHENGALRASGLVVLDEDEDDPADVLESRYRLSDEALAAFRQEAAGLIPEDLKRSKITSYKHHRELLVDLRILHNLYKHRSERVFNQDRWDRVHSSPRSPGRGISLRIRRFWDKIRRKLEQTQDAPRFPALRFMREHALAEEELIIVVHLLFKELYEGNAYADTADLIRLVSTEEADLIRNRRLLTPDSILCRAEIVQIEPLLDARELTGEVHLSDWAVNYLFACPPGDRRIRPDDRLNWHLYLESLEDTGTFFRDLEAN